jgi:hypothetical protein
LTKCHGFSGSYPDYADRRVELLQKLVKIEKEKDTAQQGVDVHLQRIQETGQKASPTIIQLNTWARP